MIFFRGFGFLASLGCVSNTEVHGGITEVHRGDPRVLGILAESWEF